VTDGVAPAEDVCAPELDEDDQRDDRQQHEIDPKLLVTPQRPQSAPDDAGEEQREVRARQDHEDHDRPLRRRREGLDRARLGREPAGGDRREGMRHRLVESHSLVQASPSQHGEHDELERRDRDVERDEASGGLPDRRFQSQLRARRLGPEESLAAGDVQAGQHCEEQDDDAEASDPLGELTPHRG
jgi:hypothetical protein